MCHRTYWQVFAAGVIALFTVAPPANGGTISDLGGVVVPGTSSVLITLPTTPSPNNDNSTTASPNGFTIRKEYTVVAPIEFQFVVNNSGGTTEYFFNETSVTNASGVAWTDFHFQLGFGSNVAFVPSTLDALDFDTPQRDPTPTSSVFATLNHQDDSIAWSGGVLPNGSAGAFTFSIDVPDHSAAIPAGFETRDPTGAITGYRFTLRQFPTVDAAVPEPTSIVLLGVGLSGLIGARRFRKRYERGR